MPIFAGIKRKGIHLFNLKTYFTKMKKFLLTLCVALMSVGASAEEFYTEPEAGDWAVGFGFNLGAGAGVTNFGLQIPKLQYYFAPRVRAEAAFNYFFKAKDVIDWNVDLDIHPYVVPMKYGLHVYPVVGIAAWKRQDKELDNEHHFRVGANFGAGFQYDITENIYANIQYKYMVTNYNSHGILNLGIAYRF